MMDKYCYPKEYEHILNCFHKHYKQVQSIVVMNFRTIGFFCIQLQQDSGGGRHRKHRKEFHFDKHDAKAILKLQEEFQDEVRLRTVDS